MHYQGYKSNFGFHVPFDRKMRQIVDKNPFLDSPKATHPVTLGFNGRSIHRSHQRGMNQCIVGLPRRNMNLKVHISGKSKVLTVKSRTKTHFRQTNTLREQKAVKSSAK